MSAIIFTSDNGAGYDRPKNTSTLSGSMFRRLLCALLIVVPFGVVSAAADALPKPNVLFITFLVDKGLLPPARADMLRGWMHSGFNVHRSRRVLPDEREDMERLAQYIIRNPLCRREPGNPAHAVP